MKMVSDYPEWIADDLVHRGHEKDDKLSPEEAFDEWCEWHGLIQWGPTFRRLYEETIGNPD